MRDIDRVVDFVIARCMEDRVFAPVQAQVMINRLHPPPTREELDKAHSQVELNGWVPFNPEYVS